MARGTLYDVILYISGLIAVNITIIVFTRHSIYAIARICHANSVCPSVRPSVISRVLTCVLSLTYLVL